MASRAFEMLPMVCQTVSHGQHTIVYNCMFASHARPDSKKKKKKKKKEVSNKKASQSKSPTDPGSAEATLSDVRALMADGPSDKTAAEQLEGSVPAEPNEPPTEPTPDIAAHTPLPVGATAARGAEADALPSSKKVAKKKNKRASDSQAVASHANDLHSDYVTITNMDLAKFQRQGYISSNLTGNKCPLDCDMLVFPVPVGKKWACAVVDMAERSITYGSSLKVLVGQSSALCPILSACCDCQPAEQHGVHSFMHPLCIQWWTCASLEKHLRLVEPNFLAF